MSVLGFYLSTYINFISTEFSTPHPHTKLILGHCSLQYAATVGAVYEFRRAAAVHYGGGGSG